MPSLAGGDLRLGDQRPGRAYLGSDMVGERRPLELIRNLCTQPSPTWASGGGWYYVHAVTFTNFINPRGRTGIASTRTGITGPYAIYYGDSGNHIEATPGETYTVRAMVDVPAAGFGTRFRVNPRGSTSSLAEVPVDSSTEEQEVVITFTAPANVPEMGLSLVMVGDPLYTTVRISDVSFTQTLFPVDYFDGDTLPTGLDPEAYSVDWSDQPNKSESILYRRTWGAPG